MTIGTHLHTIRNQFGYTQEDVSQLLGISPETLSQWEDDKRRPTETSLVTLSRLYHLNNQELLDLASEEPKERAFQKAFDVVNRAFSHFSKEQSPSLAEDDLSKILQKQGLIVLPCLAETQLTKDLLSSLKNNLNLRYYYNVQWLSLNALEAREIVAKENIDIMIFTPVTTIFTEQLAQAADNSPALISLSKELYQELTTT